MCDINSLFLLFIFQFALSVIGGPLATSSVTFTRYKKVSSSEWEDFYRNRGNPSSPTIPGRIRPSVIPVVHYSYRIDHPPVQKRHLAVKENGTRDESAIVFEDDQMPDESYKIKFPTYEEEDSTIYFPNRSHKNSDGNIEVDPRRGDFDENSTQVTHVQEFKMRLTEPGFHSIATGSDNTISDGIEKPLNENTSKSNTNSALPDEASNNQIRVVGVSPLVDEYDKLLEHNSPISNLVL